MKKIVHLFWATSSPSIVTYALARTTQDNESEFDQKIINGSFKNFSEESLLENAISTTELCLRVGFN